MREKILSIDEIKLMINEEVNYKVNKIMDQKMIKTFVNQLDIVKYDLQKWVINILSQLNGFKFNITDI